MRRRAAVFFREPDCFLPRLDSFSLVGELRIDFVAQVGRVAAAEVELDRHFGEGELRRGTRPADSAGRCVEIALGSLQNSTIVGGCTPTCVA